MNGARCGYTATRKIWRRSFAKCSRIGTPPCPLRSKLRRPPREPERAMFARMTDLIPAARRGVAEIKHVTGPEACCQLWVDGKCVMNAAPAIEIGLNRPVVEAAHGD